MAISRAQIPEQIDIFNEGGAAETDRYTELYNQMTDQFYSHHIADLTHRKLLNQFLNLLA